MGHGGVVRSGDQRLSAMAGGTVCFVVGVQNGE